MNPNGKPNSSGSLRQRHGGSFSERLPGHEPPDENSDEEGNCDCGGSPLRRNFAAKYGELTKKYSSKNFRDNPLLSNKGRSRGSINFVIQDRAGTMEIISGTNPTKPVNDKHLISVLSNNGLIASNNNH
jgi:hypothetical protein